MCIKYQIEDNVRHIHTHARTHARTLFCTIVCG